MIQPKPPLDPATALRRKFDRIVDDMSDAMKAFYLEQPDALAHAFGGGLLGYFEKARLQVPPSGLTQYGMGDAAGWKALEDGRVTVSVLTHGLEVDYRPDRIAVFGPAGVVDDPDDTEDIEDMMERRKILRAGGTVHRRLKRLWFDGDGSVGELEGLIRLKGWKTTDTRTLLAWAGTYRRQIEPDETVAASAMPLLKREGGSIRLTSGVSRMHDRRGPFYGLKREDAGLDKLKRIFDAGHSFLVEVPDDRT